MKSLFQVSIFSAMAVLLIGCGQLVTATPSPVAPSTATTTATLLLIPTQTAAATLEPTPTQGYLPPTLQPVIEPKLARDLLRKAFSIQLLEGPNGHRIRQITGWEYGFRHNPCYGYEWLDTSHLALYPSLGQESSMESGPSDVEGPPVVINLDSGSTWMPAPVWDHFVFCPWVERSEELGIIISPGRMGSYANITEKDAVVTYTFDGQYINHYWGKLLHVSPSGTKILVDDDTIIDLRNGKITELAWYMNYDYERYDFLYWSSDESRIYRCCFYYAETYTGKSYSFKLNDLRLPNGDPAPDDDSILAHGYGDWVRNDTYFLVEWNPLDDGDVGYLPMFSPTEKKIYDVRAMAGIPDGYVTQTVVSPDGKYVWMENGVTSYLVNLMTFEAVEYQTGYVNDFTWSPDSKFAWFNMGKSNKALEYDLISVSDQELKPFYTSEIQPRLEWHPSGNHFAGILNQTLLVSDVPDLAVREIATPTVFQDLRWSPDGDRIAFLAKDSSVWQIDYPALQNWEQLTPSLPNEYYLTYGMSWSPDGKSISFISGSDIYVVEVNQ